VNSYPAPAGDFLRQLYRERRLTAAEFVARLRALISGKLRLTIAPIANPLQRMGRPPLNPEGP
jgi:hypothetical protein